MKAFQESPIGMFDSGVGGLTIMREVMRALPNEDIIYVGDTARLPYGNKSAETIRRYSLEIASFLVDRNVKLLIMACNTASSYALQTLRQNLSIPIIGVIEAGSARAAATTKNHRLAILGTTATIQSEAYQQAITRLLPNANLFPIPCPMFVPLVEGDFIDHPSAKLIVREYLKDLHRKEVDTVLLGCTHYPFLSHLIHEFMGPDIHVVDSAHSCAEHVVSALDQHRLRATCRQTGSYCYFVSNDPIKFRHLGEKLFRRQLTNIVQVSFS